MLFVTCWFKNHMLQIWTMLFGYIYNMWIYVVCIFGCNPCVISRRRNEDLWNTCELTSFFWSSTYSKGACCPHSSLCAKYLHAIQNVQLYLTMWSTHIDMLLVRFQRAARLRSQTKSCAPSPLSVTFRGTSHDDDFETRVWFAICRNVYYKTKVEVYQ